MIDAPFAALNQLVNRSECHALGLAVAHLPKVAIRDLGSDRLKLRLVDGAIDSNLPNVFVRCGESLPTLGDEAASSFAPLDANDARMACALPGAIESIGLKLRRGFTLQRRLVAVLEELRGILRSGDVERLSQQVHRRDVGIPGSELIKLVSQSVVTRIVFRHTERLTLRFLAPLPLYHSYPRQVAGRWVGGVAT
jgi:hypothetical protein